MNKIAHLLLIAFISISTMSWAEFTLSICAIFKNEAPFLKEWIEFHKMQGVEHFILYNNHSEDHFQEVLLPYLLNGEVTLIDWPYTQKHSVGREWVQIQRAAYQDALQKFKDTSLWIGFIDIDEFLFCPSGESLTSFLSRYEEFGALCVNWLMFGTSGVEEIPINSLMIEKLTRCAPKHYPLNQRVKVLVRPSRILECRHAHYFVCRPPFNTVNCNKESVGQTGRLNGPSISHDQIRINHYWTRTESYFRNQKIASRQARRATQSEEALRRRAQDLNQSIDLAIQQFVPELKMRLR